MTKKVNNALKMVKYAFKINKYVQKAKKRETIRRHEFIKNKKTLDNMSF